MAFLERRRPHDADAPRPAGDLCAGGQRPGAAADPWDGRHLRELAGRDRAAGAAAHRDRTRPARAWRLGARRRRLLDRGARGRPARSAHRARPRARDARRALARRRDRDAVRLPVPRDDRAPGARLQRRARSRGQPDPARRGAPGRRPVHRRDRRPGRTVGSAFARGLAAVGLRPNADVAEVARGYASLADRDRRAAFLATLRVGRRHRRPARPRRRPALPRRGHARPDHLGGARSDHPRLTTARTRTRRFPAVASRSSKGSAICRSSRRRGASSRCSSDSSQRPSRLDSTPSSGADAFASSAASRRSTWVCDTEPTYHPLCRARPTTSRPRRRRSTAPEVPS